MPASTLSTQAHEFRSSLIDWYDAQARDLPWRRSPTLYKTVVSEFMLQQTQVKTVLPYFAAWLERYPDFATLAAASEEQVLKSWEGLGYYSRARNLHKLSQEFVAIPEDELPTTAAGWLRFPGVGPYAAAAICSISFGDSSAVIDGNVVRILTRLTADAREYKTSVEAANSYRDLAASLLNPERPGDHNQAMMELGATVCHKQSPQCLICPAQRLCRGRKEGIAETLPRLGKTKFENQSIDRAWIRCDDGILLHKIPVGAKRMRGLHELPSLEQLSLTQSKHELILERKRSITRYRITERIFQVSPDRLPASLSDDFLWATPEQISLLPFSGPHRRWVTELLELSDS